jgi:hypothetical protein
MPVVDKYKDMGMVVMGKVEAGEAKKGQSLLLMPNRVSVCLFVCQQVESKEHIASFIFGCADCECCLNIMCNSHCMMFTVVCFKCLCFVVLSSNEQIQSTFLVICMIMI